jgi:DNA repair exonuclease SbcCD ATPase subunit
MLEFPTPEYEGAEYTADELELLRQEYQGRHGEAAHQFQSIEQRYGSLTQDLTTDLGNGTQLSQQLQSLATGPSMGDKVREFFARVGLTKRKRPVSELLEEQLESVQTQIHQVAQLRESMDGHIEAVEADIRRLNGRITEAARNEETAAKHVLALSETLTEKENAVLFWDVNDHKSAAYREANSLVDELKAQIRIHGSKARSYGQAEERLAVIVKMNRNLLEMLRSGAVNMEQLTDAVHQVVDEISGNVQALTSLTLANEMALDLIQATEHLKEGVQKVAVLASETSLTLTRDVDRFVDDLQVYDEATLQQVQTNLSEERSHRQQQVDDAIAHAYATSD